MSKALIAGINQVAVDKGLDREVIFEAIEASLISAYKRNYGSVANVSAEVDRTSGEMRVFAEREVVEDVFNERTEITEDEARKLYPDAELGDVVKVQNKPDDFGRIAAQTAKQVILQRIREAERDTVYENFAHRVGEVINAQVRSVDLVSGAITLLLDEKHECLLMRDDQIPNERLRRGDYVKVYVVDVHRSTRGPVIKISRTHRNLLRRLMEQEIPEVRDGTVEIKSISREPGARSKAAVSATIPGIDPVGSCVGMRGLRIQNIVNELAGEKIDVVEWSTDLYTYISNALSPAKVTSVLLDEKNPIKTAIVVVPDRQLSLAIGKEGQNARLAAKLTGWRIDIKSESEASSEGLDQLMEEQAARLAALPPSNDLLAFAEQLLQKDDDQSVGEDLFSQAAAAIQNESPDLTPETAESMGMELPSLEELDLESFGETAFGSLEDEKASEGGLDSFDKALEEITPLEEFMPVDLNLDDFTMPELPESGIETDKEEKEELPDVITGDMLRERMAKGKQIDLSSDDFEIPAELLVGIDDVEEDSKAGEGTKRKSKGKKSSKSERKSRKRKRQSAPDDEYDELEDFI